MDTSLTFLERLQRGDNLAWKDFHELYGVRIWAKVNEILCRMCVGRNWSDDDHQFAADICQDVVVKVFIRLPSFDRQRTGSFRVWLDTITRRQVLEELRQLRNRSLDWPQEKIDFVLAQLEDPHQGFELVSKEEHDRYLVGKALSWLRSQTSEEMTVVVYRLVTQEATAEQIAKELGASVATVYLKKHRLLKMVREYVNKYMRDLLD